MFKVFKTYYSFFWHYKWQFFLFVFCLVGLGITSNIQPYFYKLFIEAIPEANQKTILFVLFSYFGVQILSLFFDVTTYFTGDAVMIPAARDARLKVFKKIQDLDFAYHLSKSTGSLISAIKRGDDSFFSLFHALNINLASTIIGFVVIMSFFWNVDWQISALMLFSLVINLFFARFLIRKNISSRAAFNEQEDKLSGIIVDNLINFETVKLFAKEDWEYKRLVKRFSPWKTKLWVFANSYRLISIVVGSISNFGIFGILLYGLYLLNNLTLSAAEYIMILGFVGSFYPKFLKLVYDLRGIAKQQADISKYFAILDEKVLVKDPKKPVLKDNIKGEIEFSKVSFAYPESNGSAIKNLNLKLRQGQSVAFVGHSGVGKTTLVKLLMRFYDVDRGKITIDGVDIRKFNKSNLRSFMGIVPQEPIMFNDTISYNIGYGIDKPSKEGIIAAAKMANLHDFILTLPEKYNTVVGERGIKLSGGQKQRLAIARMILSDPEIIIFDEATSQLDSESEKKIQDAFWKASKDKTTLIIAHRLSTITRADKIVVMELGKIKEIGSHQELINNPNSLYLKFWQMQTKSYDKAS